MFPDIAHLSPAVWGVLLGAAAVLIAAVVLTCRASALSTRKLVTIAMLTAVYVVLSLVGTLNLWWIRISVDSLPIILGALLYGPVGGLLVGLGLGLVFLSGATTGGSDIAAKLLRRRFRSASLGKVLLAIDLFIIFLTGVVFRDISRTLYSALPLAVSSVVMDQLLYGLDHSTVALIISKHYQQVSKQIETRLDRGATVLDGSGSYTGQPRPVLMSAVRQRELPELKTIVREIDPDAFVILLPAHQVLGEGFRRAGDEL